MEYFILNDHSLPFQELEDIDSALKLFFDVYKESSKANFKTIRISSNIDQKWYTIPLHEEYYIRNWIEEQETDYRIRIKSLITATQSPIFDVKDIEAKFRAGLSDFSYQKEAVPSLGACYLLNQLSISFNSNKKWDKVLFEIEHQELKAEADNIETSIVTVNNVTTVTHWIHHFSSIEKQMILNLKKSNEIIKDFGNQFPHIKLTPKSIKQLENNKFPLAFFKQIWHAIDLLNKYVEHCIETKTPLNYTSVKKHSSLNITDESPTVKNNPNLKRHRLFRYNSIQYFFGYHIKNFTSSNRIHFLIQGNKIIIGYIGKHLPLK